MPPRLPALYRHEAGDSLAFPRLATAPCSRLPMPEVWLWASRGPASPRTAGPVVAHHKAVPRRMMIAAPGPSAVAIAVPLLPCNTESRTFDLTAMRDFEYRDEYIGLKLPSVVDRLERLTIAPRKGRIFRSVPLMANCAKWPISRWQLSPCAPS